MKSRLLPLKCFVKRFVFYGNSRYCNVCQKSWRTFLPEGTPVREQSRCPWCNSLERHRLTWEFFQKRTDLFDGQLKRVLHVAPERCFVPPLRRKLGTGYVTADLQNPADFQWDITAIPQPDGSFDVIYCSHVLEHVLADRQAMSEFYRVLKPGGWAVLNVPITVEETFEDPTVTDPEERLRRFGQKDHVRCYGPDYVDRLREAGFQVEAIYPRDLVLGGRDRAASTRLRCFGRGVLLHEMNGRSHRRPRFAKTFKWHWQHLLRRRS